MVATFSSSFSRFKSILRISRMSSRVAAGSSASLNAASTETRLSSFLFPVIPSRSSSMAFTSRADSGAISYRTSPSKTVFAKGMPRSARCSSQNAACGSKLRVFTVKVGFAQAPFTSSGFDGAFGSSRSALRSAMSAARAFALCTDATSRASSWSAHSPIGWAVQMR